MTDFGDPPSNAGPCSTGVVYDDSVAKHRCLWDPNYPENPARYLSIIKRCEELNLLNRCKKIPSREATQEEIATLHTKDIISLLQQCERKNEIELEDVSSRYDSVYICPETYKAALLSAGSTIQLVEAVCNNDVKNGMAIVRPPGHHAMKSEFCGYCFFNNVAVAANYALTKLNFKKILIVDWDVHHGQATQQMFYNDSRVLYFSIHRYEHGLFWPNLEESNCNFIGEGNGAGYNFNVPLNKTGLGNADYLAIFQELLLPVATEFQPELVLVSGGYDSAFGDAKGEMLVSPACYAHFINALSAFAAGKIAVILEGGYFLQSLAEGAALTLRALLGDPCPKIQPLEQASESVLESIRNVIFAQRPYWKCFQLLYGTFAPTNQPLQSNTFIPNYRFVGHIPRPEKYETRNSYPVQLDETIVRNTNLLNDLIRNTSLRVPEFRCNLIIPSPSKLLNSLRVYLKNWSGKVTVMNIDEKINYISEAIRQILDASVRSLIIDKSEFYLAVTSNPSFLASQLIQHSSTVKRVIFINLQTQNTFLQSMVKEHFLSFSFTNNEVDQLKSNNTDESPENRHQIEISLDRNTNKHTSEQIPLENYQFITAWLKIISPICYQFDPDLVIVDADFQRHGVQVSPEVQGYIIRWLTSLANGRIILLTNFDDTSKEKYLNLMANLKAILGDALPIPKSSIWPATKIKNEMLRYSIQRQSSRWSNVNALVNFPDEGL